MGRFRGDVVVVHAAVVMALISAVSAFERGPLKPWTLATTADFKGYIATEERVNATGPRLCKHVVAEVCMMRDPSLVRRQCGAQDDDPVVENGIRREFKFFACLTELQAPDEWCFVEGIRVRPLD